MLGYHYTKLNKHLLAKQRLKRSVFTLGKMCWWPRFLSVLVLTGGNRSFSGCIGSLVILLNRFLSFSSITVDIL